MPGERWVGRSRCHLDINQVLGCIHRIAIFASLLPVLCCEYQIYGKLKADLADTKHLDIELLLQEFPRLRVAYVDVVEDQGTTDYFSVLLRANAHTRQPEEVGAVHSIDIHCQRPTHTLSSSVVDDMIGVPGPASWQSVDWGRQAREPKPCADILWWEIHPSPGHEPGWVF